MTGRISRLPLCLPSQTENALPCAADSSKAVENLVRGSLPAIVTAAGESAALRFLEFFAASIRNAHTRRAYAGAVGEFLAWCEGMGVESIAAVQPLHFAAYIKVLSKARAAPTAKQRLAAIRRLFDWFVVGKVIPFNPAPLCVGRRIA